jgi:hypothetical protein
LVPLASLPMSARHKAGPSLSSYSIASSTLRRRAAASDAVRRDVVCGTVVHWACNCRQSCCAIAASPIHSGPRQQYYFDGANIGVFRRYPGRTLGFGMVGRRRRRKRNGSDTTECHGPFAHSSTLRFGHRVVPSVRPFQFDHPLHHSSTVLGAIRPSTSDAGSASVAPPTIEA